MSPFGRLVLGLTAAAFIAGVSACSPAPPPSPTPERDLQPVEFGALERWGSDDPRGALSAFVRSCEVLTRQEPSTFLVEDDPTFGIMADWQPACAAARTTPVAGAEDARRFFEEWFQPYRVLDNGDPEGLFTGYYEPLLAGSRSYGGPYVVPLYRVPDDILVIDLGQFSPELAGRQIKGRVEGNQVVPYYSRLEIDDGALTGRALEILWVDDPVDKFFLQIQGSGRVRLNDGSFVRVGYAGENGHAYRAIGRDLIASGEIAAEDMSMQAIRRWLEENPTAAGDLMARNRSYVFFDERGHLNPEDGPVGAQGVPLTAGRSLAVDRRFIPLGTPIWLETEIPSAQGDVSFERLMVAQDIGGAVKGVVRGDVFFGTGDRAGATAGRMKHQGRMTLLLPRTLTPLG